MYRRWLLLTTLLTTSCCLDNTTLITLTTPRHKLLINETSTLTLQLEEPATEDLVFNCTPSSPDLVELHGGYQITVSYSHCRVFTFWMCYRSFRCFSFSFCYFFEKCSIKVAFISCFPTFSSMRTYFRLDL